MKLARTLLKSGIKYIFEKTITKMKNNVSSRDYLSHTIPITYSLHGKLKPFDLY